MFDFPSDTNLRRGAKNGFAYSPFADIALMVSTLACAAGALMTVVWSIGALVNRMWLEGFVIGPIAFLIQVGLLVAFLRVQS